jgi:DNA-binding MarR family transcriptional regulator
MVNGLIMWSIGQIAERDGVSKAAISKAVKKLIEQRPETPKELDGQGRVLLVSVAHYDEFRQRFVNPAKATAPIRAAGEMGNVAAGASVGPG